MEKFMRILSPTFFHSLFYFFFNFKFLDTILSACRHAIETWSHCRVGQTVPGRTRKNENGAQEVPDALTSFLSYALHEWPHILPLQILLDVRLPRHCRHSRIFFLSFSLSDTISLSVSLVPSPAFMPSESESELVRSLPPRLYTSFPSLSHARSSLPHFIRYTAS